MSKPEFRRLERIEVDRLFNVYDHRIDLKLDDRVTLLHGPNGSGKTVILRMIDALLNARLSYFERIPFSRLAIGFHDGSAIALHKSATDGNAATLKVYENGKEEHSAQVRLRTEAERITASIGHLQHHPTIPDAWIDTRDGELLMSPEVISRYGDLFSQSNAEGDSPRTPVWFQSFLKAVNTHLIEEQRLFQFGEGHRDRPPRRRYWQSGASALVSTVVEYGHEFRTRLADTMADYGRQSQTLDQSFLHRLITAKEEMTVNELVCHISDIKKKTDELKNLGILEETQASPIPVGMLEDIDSTQARVMTLYVHDTTAKLAMLDALKDRSLLLLETMNQKYRHKNIRVHREHGLVAVSDDGQRLDLDCLSSGEQHELVLYYDLLFRVPSNTIVLIDEPELSLHVAWQKKFLPDLLEIIKLSSFDTLIATHSPYIVGDKPELMIGLGGSD